MLSIILIVIQIGFISTAFDYTVFRQQALVQHNLYRQVHNVTSMTLNSTLNSIAQNYSEYLAVNNLFQHSGASGLGENLWDTSSSNPITYINGSQPVIAWYDEISSYNFSAPGFSSATGHFTQVVWAGSTELGIGIAWSSDNKTVTVVANYYPAGNVIGSFPQNVFPPNWNNIGGD